MSRTSQWTRRLRIGALQLAVTTVLLVFAAAASATFRTAQQTNSPMSDTSLWQLIERLAERMPFGKDNFEEALGAPLTLQKEDQFKSQWIGGEMRLRDNIQISNVSLMLGPSGEFKPTSGAMLNLAGACVTRDQIKVHFDDLKLVSQPRGRSLREVAAWGIDQPWGRLIFAFRQNNPDCLAYVTLRGTDQE